MRILPSLLAFLFCGTVLIAQPQEKEVLSIQEQAIQLADLSTTIIKDSLVENRLKAHEALEKQLVKTLEQPNSFDYPFEEIEAISIQMPADSSFRIFTWQLFVDNETYRYGGVLQVNRAENALYALTDNSAAVEPYDLEYEIHNPEEWYGALYYNIHEFDTLDQKKYLLFGFDGFQFFHKRKVVDVLSFDEEGQPSFGAPVFSITKEGYPPNTKNRLYAEYDASISVRLNYDPSMHIIIQDHLMQMQGQYRGQGMVNVPDGSYEGYHFQDGLWQYKEKIFDFISEEPPRPKPILGADKRTLFGGKVKGN